MNLSAASSRLCKTCRLLSCGISALLMLLSAPYLIGQTFKAVDDTIDLVPGFEKTVNLTANDLIPAGDSIRITGGLSAGDGSVVSTWHYQGIFTYLVRNRGVGNLIIGTYTLINLSSAQSSTGKIIFRIRDKSWDTLQINDMQALFTVSGFHFYLLFGNSGFAGGSIPKGSGKTTLFSNTFWIGGLDDHDSLHLAAELYRQGPLYSSAGTKPDFYAGPVMDSSQYTIYQDTTWNYVWNLKKTDIDYHKAHWNDPGYIPINDILTWPGNGDVALGQAHSLAPFHDENGDGFYAPVSGDYPDIRGDQALFFIFNDDRGNHLETRGLKLRTEIHGMAYAFNLPGDSAFSKTIFLHYRIHNRSSQTYYNTYMGTYTDMDIGFAADDYQQCDVGRGSIIGYNGWATDGHGEKEAYGAHPPAQSVTLLAGPRMAPAGSDRPRFDNNGHQLCNESINGAGFGDGIADNERFGLMTFSYFNNPFSNPLAYMDQPVTPSDYYNYLQAIWMDSTRMVYGGNGHDGYGGHGPEASYLFPGESDTLNWGCGCLPPNGPVNWTEVTAGNNPHDIKGVGTTGPFTFFPGAVEELDIAFVWARDYTSNDSLASVAKLRTAIDTIRKAFLTNRLPGGGSFMGARVSAFSSGINCDLFPNPANEAVVVRFNADLKRKTRLDIYNAAGKLMATFELARGSKGTVVDVSEYPVGLYLFSITGDDLHLTKKVAVKR
jgi:hypothetical protein